MVEAVVVEEVVVVLEAVIFSSFSFVLSTAVRPL
jgi:hypothetical protein